MSADIVGRRLGASLPVRMAYGLALLSIVLLGLFLAVVIDALSQGQWLYRLIFFLPVAATLVAMATVWKYLLPGAIGRFFWRSWRRRVALISRKGPFSAGHGMARTEAMKATASF